jgi:hypothetical protein
MKQKKMNDTLAACIATFERNGEHICWRRCIQCMARSSYLRGPPGWEAPVPSGSTSKTSTNTLPLRKELEVVEASIRAQEAEMVRREAELADAQAWLGAQREEIEALLKEAQSASDEATKRVTTAQAPKTRSRNFHKCSDSTLVPRLPKPVDGAPWGEHLLGRIRRRSLHYDSGAERNGLDWNGCPLDKLLPSPEEVNPMGDDRQWCEK